MIDDTIFDSGMETLQTAFDRQIDPSIQEIWKDELDQHLNDDDFTEAVRLLILNFEQRFRGHFPSAKQLLEIVAGSKESKALQEWQAVLMAARRADQSVLAYASTRAYVALKSIGGLQAVGIADEYKTERLRKDFVTVYCQCAGKDAKVLPQAEVMQHKPEVYEYQPIPEHIKQQMEDLKRKITVNGTKH